MPTRDIIHESDTIYEENRGQENRGQTTFLDSMRSSWGFAGTISLRDQAHATTSPAQPGWGPLVGIGLKLSVDCCYNFNRFSLLSQALVQDLRACPSFS